MPDFFPPLRQVEAAPVEHEGQTLVCLYDSEGYADEQILLSPHAYLVAVALDGETGVEGIQALFRAQFDGAEVQAAQIAGIVEYLDEHGFLDSPRFDALRGRVEGEFRAAPARPAHHAGRAYPEDPAALRDFLDAFFACDEGPGALGAPGGGPPPALVVSPHIDFHRGGFGYAHAYRALHAAGKPHTVLLFGVAHQYAPVPFVLTTKDFDTPFGTLRTNAVLAERLAAACGWDPFEHEIVHRTEHSLEFQAVMLAYLYGPEVEIVPILCGAMAGDDDAIDGAVAPFLEACAAIAAGPGVTVIAGADLAHVGRRFGDPIDIDDAVLDAIVARDREDLACVEAGAPDAWYASVMRDGNARKVCGLGCIYAAMKSAARAGRADLLHYDCAPDPAGGVVSFASLVGR